LGRSVIHEIESCALCVNPAEREVTYRGQGDTRSPPWRLAPDERKSMKWQRVNQTWLEAAASPTANLRWRWAWLPQEVTLRDNFS